MLRDLSALLLGVQCVLCGAGGEWLCARCARGLRPDSRRLSSGLRVIAAGGREQSLVQAVSLWKDSGVRGLTRPFARLLHSAFEQSRLSAEACAALPQRAAARRARGWAPVAELAREFSALSGLPLVGALQFEREVLDQRSLTLAARQENLSNSLCARDRWEQLLLIDDVVTTGATLLEATRAVRAAGGSVTMALTLVAAR